MIAALTRLLCGAVARWVDCEPPTGQRIYFANHSSHLDFAVIWSSLPPSIRRRTRPVAAEDYWTQSRLRRWLAVTVFRAVLIPRSNISRANNPITTRNGIRNSP